MSKTLHKTCPDDCCTQADPPETTSTPTDTDAIQKTYQVAGMDCGQCALTVEKGVQQMAGIQSAKVNFSTGKLMVVADDAQALTGIPKTVTQLGYAVVPTTSTKSEANWLKSKLFLSILPAVRCRSNIPILCR